jgi:hypothetical protein
MYDKEFYQRNLKFQTALSRELTPLLCVNRFQFKSVIDFGCGCGKLLSDIVRAKDIKKYSGINGDIPDNLQIPRHHLNVFNFNIYSDNVVLFGQMDLAISLEVAEHIEPQYAGDFISLITRCARKYIIFSAATPGQGGIGHVNEQPHEHWHDLFLCKGWVHRDIIRPALAAKKHVPFWYRNNIFMYERER